MFIKLGNGGIILMKQFQRGKTYKDHDIECYDEVCVQI